jgi:hypothetical protein
MSKWGLPTGVCTTCVALAQPEWPNALQRWADHLDQITHLVLVTRTIVNPRDAFLVT